MKEWHIIHECDTENGTPTQWSKEIDHPKYGQYVWIELTYNNTYEGVNLAMCYCEDCGYQQVEMDVCPKCGSKMITKIDRMNGYLGFTRVHGETRYNEAKNAEIKDRVSM